MRSYFALVLLALSLLTFSACSNHRVFEPEDIVDDRDLVDGYDKEVFMQHRKGITYENGVILTKQGLFTKFALPKGFAYLNENNHSIIAADNGGKILIKSKEGESEKLLTLNSRVLSAVVEGDILALVNVKNEMKIYSLATQKEMYTFSGSAATAIDIRLANPRLYEGLLFFPTLDGKIQIFSQASKKMIRTMSVSSDEQFNNIIFFDIIDKKVLAATGTKLYIFGKKSFKKALPIRDVIVDNDSIVVLRKDGKITSFNQDLVAMHEEKYAFAHFLGGLSTKDAFYIVESEGYLIKLTKDFSRSMIYELDFDEGLFFVGDKSFYFSDGYLTP